MWIQYGGYYPDSCYRFYHRERAQWNNPPIHERLQANPGVKTGKLYGHLNHYSFPTLTSQWQKNNHYAILGALKLQQQNAHPPAWYLITKPLGKFFECYVYKAGFLDGRYGLIIAINAAISQFKKYALFLFEFQKDR